MPDNTCANHPARAAVERCEVCGKPLCAYCLYYTEDGQRLCVMHAELARQIGVQIEEPGRYAEHLIGAQAGFGRGYEPPQERLLYKGNSHDLTALIAAVLGLIVAASCCTLGMGSYCLPVVGFLLSLIAVLNAKHAHDPSRSRKLGYIGMITSGLFALIAIGIFALYAVMLQDSIRFINLSSGGQPIILTTPVTDTPTPTIENVPSATVAP
jgi:hypothetical protein